MYLKLFLKDGSDFFIETAKIICGNIWVNQLFSLSLHEQTV